MTYRGYFYVALATTLNIVLYALTFGNHPWLEGRVRGGTFKNWGRRFRYRPPKFVEPTTEAEIVELVKNSTRVRFFGSGHSFNDGVITERETTRPQSRSDTRGQLLGLQFRNYLVRDAQR